MNEAQIITIVFWTAVIAFLIGYLVAQYQGDKWAEKRYNKGRELGQIQGENAAYFRNGLSRWPNSQYEPWKFPE